MAKSRTWVDDLRSTLKREHGAGWSVREKNNTAQLTRRFEDGTRSSVAMGLGFNASNGSAIAARVSELRALMEERNLSLAEANRLKLKALNVGSEAAAAGAINWSAVAEAFLSTKADCRTTTRKDYEHRINNVLRTLQTKPCPRDGRSLMRAYATQHFQGCPPGGVGRGRHLGDVAAFLDYAVDRAGAPSRWRPLKGDELQELIGTSDRGATHELTPPIKPDQLAALLDQLEMDGRADLRLAVALVGLYGLRPAELAALKVEDGRLYVGGQVKRNKRTMANPKPSRLVAALDIPGREGEGARVLNQYISGLIKLPNAIQTQVGKGNAYKGVGDAFRQLLERYPFWQSLVAATPGLTPYSLRHGFAWRAHKAYARPLSTRDCAALMGHNPSTHHKHYGKWTDEEGLLEAVASLKTPLTPQVVLGTP